MRQRCGWLWPRKAVAMCRLVLVLVLGLARESRAACTVSLLSQGSDTPTVLTASKGDLLALKVSGFSLSGCDSQRVLFFHGKSFTGPVHGPFTSDQAEAALPAQHKDKISSVIITQRRCIAFLHQKKLADTTAPKFAFLNPEADIAAKNPEIAKSMQALKILDCEGFRVSVFKDKTITAPITAKTNNEQFEAAAPTPVAKLTLDEICLHVDGTAKCSLTTSKACAKKEVFREMRLAGATKSKTGLACLKWSGVSFSLRGF